MNKPQPISLLQLCELFEIDIKTMPDMRPAPMPIMEKRLEELKTIFKHAYRKLAIKYHPDKGANEKQVEHFKKITSVYKDISKLKVMPLPKPRPVMRTVIIRTGGYGGTTSSTTSGSWGGTWHYTSSGGGSGDDTA